MMRGDHEDAYCPFLRRSPRLALALARARQRPRAAGRHQPAAAQRPAPHRQLGLDGADDRRQHARGHPGQRASDHVQLHGHGPGRRRRATGPGTPAQPPNRWGTLEQAARRVAGRTATTASRCRARSGARARSAASTRSTASRRTTRTTTCRTTGWSRRTRRVDRARRRACVVRPGRLAGATPGPGVGPNGATATGDRADGFPANRLRRRSSAAVWRSRGDGQRTPMTCTFAQQRRRRHHRDAGPHALRPDDVRPRTRTPASGVDGQRPGPAARHRRPFQGMWSYFPGWSTGGRVPLLGQPGRLRAPCPSLRRRRAQPGGARRGRAAWSPSRRRTTLATQADTTTARRSGPLGHAPLRRDADGRDVRGRQVLPLERSDTAPATRPTATTRQGGCRHEYIILLTDGAPNLDLQPAAAARLARGGPCPFKLPETTAAPRSNNGEAPAVRHRPLGPDVRHRLCRLVRSTDGAATTAVLAASPRAARRPPCCNSRRRRPCPA